MHLGERLTYAVFGLVIGGMLGAVAWFLYGLGYSLRTGGLAPESDVETWIKAAAAIFAVLGIVLSYG